MKAIVTVVGKDKVGIIAAVCVHLASYNVNVLDISQTVMQGYFTMMMVVDVSECNVPVAELAKQMDEKGKELFIHDFIVKNVKYDNKDAFEKVYRKFRDRYNLKEIQK